MLIRIDVSSSSPPWQRLAQQLHKEERDRHHSRVRRRARRAAMIGTGVLLLIVAFLFALANVN